jgi:hypothetical protein
VANGIDMGAGCEIEGKSSVIVRQKMSDDVTETK